MIAHVKLDLVDDGVIGEIDEKDFRWRISKNELGVPGCSHERILNAIGRDFVVDANANSHRMYLGGVVQIDDGLPDDLAVWNVEVNAVVGAQTGGAPVDLHVFGKALADLSPVADPNGPATLIRNAATTSP